MTCILILGRTDRDAISRLMLWEMERYGSWLLDCNIGIFREFPILFTWSVITTIYFLVKRDLHFYFFVACDSQFRDHFTFKWTIRESLCSAWNVWLCFHRCICDFSTDNTFSNSGFKDIPAKTGQARQTCWDWDEKLKEPTAGCKKFELGRWCHNINSGICFFAYKHASLYFYVNVTDFWLLFVTSERSNISRDWSLQKGIEDPLFKA